MLSLLGLFALVHVGVAVEMAPDGKPIRISTVPEHKELACLNALDCTSCLEESNCGWCQGKKCVPGGPSGPFSGSCSTWSFDYCPNQSECPYTTCSSCLDDADCGWCQSSHHCFLGNATQPLDGNCDSSSYYYTSCPGSTSESVDYYITFPANTFGCDVCGLEGEYICYDGTFALPNSTVFFDPTPSGSVITQIKLGVYGVWATVAEDYQVYFNLNNDTNVPIVVEVPENQPGFTCTSTCVVNGGETDEFDSGIPGWNYGGNIFIGWSGYQGNNVCFTQLELTIIYNVIGRKKV